MTELITFIIESPLGKIGIRGDENAIHSVTFDPEEAMVSKHIPELMMRCAKQLNEYFAGTRTVFDLPLSLKGTPFQIGVWKTLQTLSYGTTATYSALAIRLGDEKKVRAVGAANGKNPIGIIIPCHRIIGADGNLIGYAGGLWRKQWLLEHENRFAHGVRKLFD